jgi:hypothetical protein
MSRRLLSAATIVAATAAVLAAPSGAWAHHSYAMFDGASTRTVRGTLARVEWRNPHVYLWVYVPRADGGGHDLYAFENGAVPVLERMGWRRDTLAAGEALTVDYSPLKDGRAGGHLLKLTRGDGSVLAGAGGLARPATRPAP